MINETQKQVERERLREEYHKFSEKTLTWGFMFEGILIALGSYAFGLHQAGADLTNPNEGNIAYYAANVVVGIYSLCQTVKNAGLRDCHETLLNKLKERP